MSTIDPSDFISKTVAFRFLGVDLRLDLSHALFSSNDVDRGTRLLLRHAVADGALAHASRILDEGTGTGIIGIAVASALPTARVTMRDKDLLALSFARRNAMRALPQEFLSQAEGAPIPAAQGSAGHAPDASRLHILCGCLADGYGGGSFDYILSNIPAKAGSPVLEAFFLACGRSKLLAEGGTLAVVVVNPLADAVGTWVEAAGLGLRLRERGSDHSVFIAGKPGASDTGEDSPPARTEKNGILPLPLARPVALCHQEALPACYVRNESTMPIGGRSIRTLGFYGLPDFDTPGYKTTIAVEVLKKVLKGALVRSCFIADPGIGHLALWLADYCGTRSWQFWSRDGLSLLAARQNILRIDPDAHCDLFDPFDAKEPDAASEDLVVWNPDLVPGVPWAPHAWEMAGRLCKLGAVFLVVSTPTEIARLTKVRPSGWQSLVTKTVSGFCATAYRRI